MAGRGMDQPGAGPSLRQDRRHDLEDELEQLRVLSDQGLVELDADSLRVTAAGWFVVRAVAMVFDRYLQQQPDQRFLSAGCRDAQHLQRVAVRAGGRSRQTLQPLPGR